MSYRFPSVNYKLIFITLITFNLWQCNSVSNTTDSKEDKTLDKPVAKTEVWQQYLKRESAALQFAEIPLDSNRFLVLDYNHITLYIKSQLQFEDSLVIQGESDSFLVYNFYKNTNYQIGLNKLDSTMILTSEVQTNGIPNGKMEYFKKKTASKDASGN